MAAICYSGPILAFPTNEQFLGEKKMCAKDQVDISKTVGLVPVYMYIRTYRYTDGHGYYIYIIYILDIPSFFPFGCYKLRDKLFRV